MMIAARWRDVEEVDRLLEHRPDLIDLHGDDANGTPLISATKAGSVEVVRLLIRRGAALDVRDDDEFTALEYACAQQHEVIATLLVEGGANAALADSRGLTPLMVASANGATRIVKMLLRHGGDLFDINSTDMGGRTALWLAVLNRHEDTARALLLAGADPCIPTRQGWTAKQMAHDHGLQACIALLERFEREVARPYHLHKARMLHEEAVTRACLPTAPIPGYLRQRVAVGVPPPTLLPATTRDEEGEGGGLGAVVRYVVEEMNGELYRELMEGLGGMR